MAFDSWHDFLLMGGHGVYVWSAYAMTLIVMLWLIIAPLLRQRQLLRDIAAQERRRSVGSTTTPVHQTGADE